MFVLIWHSATVDAKCKGHNTLCMEAWHGYADQLCLHTFAFASLHARSNNIFLLNYSQDLYSGASNHTGPRNPHPPTHLVFIMLAGNARGQHWCCSHSIHLPPPAACCC